jgi:hypothetical protein
VSEHIQPDSFSTFQGIPAELSSPPIVSASAPFPDWISRRLLRPGETVTWVRGPRHSPSWERYITHPALILVPVVPGVLVMVVAAQAAGAGAAMAVCAITFACALPFLFVLGFSAGYFTRLVVTNFRLLIVQGYELCWDCGIDHLPPSLVRYDRRGEKAARSVDLDALQTALGGSSTQFVEAKTILKFARQVDRTRSGDNRPGANDKTLPDH